MTITPEEEYQSNWIKAEYEVMGWWEDPQLLTDSQIDEIDIGCGKISLEKPTIYKATRHFYEKALLKTQLAEVQKHRLDRPELRKKIARDLAYWHQVCMNETHQDTTERWLIRADQILALFDEEEIGCANCDTPLETSYQKQQIVDARLDERGKIVSSLRQQGWRSEQEIMELLEDEHNQHVATEEEK